LAQYTEVESGKRNDRPKLLKAIEHSKLTGSTLLIAKLDRLSRDAHFLLGLEKTGVEFIACDMPAANRLTIGIMAMVAEEERRLISDRTRAALAAAKARGVVLGCPTRGKHLQGLGNASAVSAILREANERAKTLKPVLESLEACGVRSAGAQARELNDQGIKTARGGRWTAQSVLNLRRRVEAFQ
jgi:DNA invertase Pin-like site-specific DNA recombinase